MEKLVLIMVRGYSKTVIYRTLFSTMNSTSLGSQCYFVGEKAFGLSTRMMWPYPGACLPENKRISNYRLPSVHRVIENAFGILASRWRVLRQPIALCSLKTDELVTACLCLHNFLKTLDKLKEPNHRQYCLPNFVDQRILIAFSAEACGSKMRVLILVW